MASSIGLMAVLNVTPDSFSDGGTLTRPEAIVQAARHAMVATAPALPLWLDVGGESTRPGTDPVSEPDELARVLPAIQTLSELADVNISVDTRRANVAQSALHAGVRMINDVSAGEADPLMLATAAEFGAHLVLMHAQPLAETVIDPWPPILEHLRTQAQKALAAGVTSDKLWLDPGFGFGKSVAQNLAMLSDVTPVMQLAQALGHGVVMGTSRKSFLTRRPYPEAMRALPPRDRDPLTAASLVPLIQASVQTRCPMLLRVHHVAAMADVLRLFLTG